MHSATLDGSVHGVVVHARNQLFSKPLRLKRTKTEVSFTSLYPCATSCEESAVPHRGQYGTILCPLYKRPFFQISLSAHHTDSIYLSS